MTGPTITATELAQRIRRHNTHCDPALAQTFLNDWKERGVVDEVLPGRYRLSQTGRAMFGDAWDALELKDAAA